MGRERKEGCSRTFKLKKDLVDKLDSHSKRTSLPKTAIVEKALALYFEKNDVK